MSAVQPGLKIILFGATGMVGQGCLRECLIDPGVASVLSIGRGPSSPDMTPVSFVSASVRSAWMPNATGI
jgi:hypothetical protein